MSNGISNGNKLILWHDLRYAQVFASPNILNQIPQTPDWFYELSIYFLRLTRTGFCHLLAQKTNTEMTQRMSSK